MKKYGLFSMFHSCGALSSVFNFSSFSFIMCGARGSAFERKEN